jgi:hypothetical protein
LYYLAAATYGPENVLGREVIVTGDTQARLELTFASGAATAGGVVRGPDGEPVSGATVALLPIPGNRQDRYLYKTTISDQLGRFSIDGITPGEYDIYAWEHVPENAYRNAGFMAGFTNRGERVRLERNSGTDLDLDLIPQD